MSVVGAGGGVGSSTAFNITVNGLADELVLIGGSRPGMIAFQTLDLSTLASGQDRLVRAGGVADMAGSDIVIVAASSHKMVSSRMELLAQNLPIIKGIARNIKQYCPDAVVITATNPVCPLNYAIHLCLGGDRRKLLGYTNNDSIRFRIWLAQALGTKVSQTEGTVIGEHGPSEVLLFSSARVIGKQVPVSEDIKQKIRLQVPAVFQTLEELTKKTGRTAAWTTSVGIADMCQAIVYDARKMIPCSVPLDGEYGCHNTSIGVPAILGRGGVLEVLKWKLTPEESKAFEHSVKTLAPAMQYVAEHLDSC